mmetsp:Transcript_7828/g.16131  ORF Transcript_7828/g.16131 Transcript_7828/m.16131 type:complete len:221 (-) Transcript_7828:392-1054(-)
MLRSGALRLDSRHPGSKRHDRQTNHGVVQELVYLQPQSVWEPFSEHRRTDRQGRKDPPGKGGNPPVYFPQLPVAGLDGHGFAGHQIHGKGFPGLVNEKRVSKTVGTDEIVGTNRDGNFSLFFQDFREFHRCVSVLLNDGRVDQGLLFFRQRENPGLDVRPQAVFLYLAAIGQADHRVGFDHPAVRAETDRYPHFFGDGVDHRYGVFSSGSWVHPVDHVFE